MDQRAGDVTVLQPHNVKRTKRITCETCVYVLRMCVAWLWHNVCILVKHKLSQSIYIYMNEWNSGLIRYRNRFRSPQFTTHTHKRTEANRKLKRRIRPPTPFSRVYEKKLGLLTQSLALWRSGMRVTSNVDPTIEQQTRWLFNQPTPSPPQNGISFRWKLLAQRKSHTKKNALCTHANWPMVIARNIILIYSLPVSQADMEIRWGARQHHHNGNN